MTPAAIALVTVATLAPPIFTVLFALFVGLTGWHYVVLLILLLAALLLSWLAWQRLASTANIVLKAITWIAPILAGGLTFFLASHGELAWLADAVCRNGWLGQKSCTLSLGTDTTDAQIYDRVNLDLKIGWGSRTPDPFFDRCQWRLEVDGKPVLTAAGLPADGSCRKDPSLYIGRDLFTARKMESSVKVLVSVSVADGSVAHDVGSAETTLRVVDQRRVILTHKPNLSFYRFGDTVAITAMLPDDKGNLVPLEPPDLEPGEVCALVDNVDLPVSINSLVSRDNQKHCEWTLTSPKVATKTNITGGLTVRLDNRPSRDVTEANVTLAVYPDDITLPVPPQVVWADDREILRVGIKDQRLGDIWLCDWSPPEALRDSAGRPCFDAELDPVPSLREPTAYVTKIQLQVTVRRKVEDTEIFVARSDPAAISFVRAKRPKLGAVNDVIVGEKRGFEVTLDPERSVSQGWSCQISAQDDLIRVDGSGCGAYIEGLSIPPGNSGLQIVIKTPAGDSLPVHHDIKVLPRRPIVIYPVVESTVRMLEKLPDGRSRVELAYEAVETLEDRAQRGGTYSALMTFGAPGAIEQVCKNWGGVRRIIAIGSHGGTRPLTSALPRPDPASVYAPQLSAWLAAVDDYQRFKEASGIEELEFMPVVIAARWDNCRPDVNEQGAWRAFIEALAPTPQAEILRQPTTIPFAVITAHLPPPVAGGGATQNDLPLFLFFAEDGQTFKEIIDAINLVRLNDPEANRLGCTTLANLLREQEYGLLAEELEAKARCYSKKK